MAMPRDKTTAAKPSGNSPDDLLIATFNAARDELVSTLMYVLGDRDDAQDAAQEAFLKCWRARDQVPDLQNIRAWIFRVALNTAKDLRRSAWHRKSREFSGEEREIPGREDVPGGDVEEQDALARVRLAIQDLRPEEREVFLLRQNGEFTYEQIAELRGAPIGTVKTQMRSALIKLKRILGGEPAEDPPEPDQRSSPTNAR
jgi:RNA polymerase sigma-70 factor (ECF subfamily)